MLTLKRIAIIAASAGAGFAVVLTLVIGGLLWFQSQPKRWDERGITASFDHVRLSDGVVVYLSALDPTETNRVDETAKKYGATITQETPAVSRSEGSEYTLEFRYSVFNNTPVDYRPAQGSSTLLVKRGASLTKDTRANGDFSVFIPAGQRVEFGINYVFSIPDPYAKYGGHMLGLDHRTYRRSLRTIHRASSRTMSPSSMDSRCLTRAVRCTSIFRRAGDGRAVIVVILAT
jgi:hypothetical protein